jgi:hypothetical protein
MFPGGSPREDKQDLFPAGRDGQEELSDNQNVFVFRNTLFSRLQELSAIQQQEELLAEVRNTPNRVQEFFQEEQASKHVFFSEDNKTYPNILPECSAIKLPNENRISEDLIFHQPVLSETSGCQQDDESGVFGGSEKQRNTEDIISETAENKATFSSSQIAQRTGQNVCSRSFSEEQCTLSESSTAAQGAFSGNLILGQQVLAGDRVSQRIDLRMTPRQLHMGK